MSCRGINVTGRIVSFQGAGVGEHHNVMVMKNQATAEHKFGGEPASCSGSGESVSAQLLISLIAYNCLTGNFGQAQDSHLKIAIQVAIYFAGGES